MRYKMPTKAVIPDAGFASRFLPITKTIPKAMLPMGAKPVMQLLIEECVAAGIRDIIVVATPEGKAVYEDYFYNPVERMHKQLEGQGKLDRFESVKEVLEMANVTVIEQDPTLPYGNGTPLVCARPYLDEDEAVVYFYGDDLILGAEGGDVKVLLETYEKYPEVAGIAMAQEVPEETWNRYGMVALKDKKKQTLDHIVEKPKTSADSPSNMIVYGRFLVTPAIFKYMVAENTGIDGELWMSDMITKLVADGDVLIRKGRGRWLTTGDPVNYFAAYTEFIKMKGGKK